MAADKEPEDLSGRRASRTEALLGEQGERLGCAAIALLSDAGTVRRLWARSESAREFAETQLKSLASLVIARNIAQREVIASNRVRLTDDGPVVARLASVPLGTSGKQPFGALAALWRPSDPAFKKSTVRTLQRFGDKLARKMPPNRDTTTGLLTWSGFCGRLERIAATHPADTNVAILYGNIDRLHVLNDARGMGAGDQAIVYAGLVIRRAVCDVSHAACRLSGDRFVVALPEQSIDNAKLVAEKIRRNFEEEAQRKFGAGSSLTFSWGVVGSRAAQDEIQRALADAELACRAAKDRGRNRVETFEATDASMIRRHDDIEALRLLRDAVDGGRLLIYAQPIVPLLNEQLPTMYELLVRIAADDGRIAEPAEFMSAAARYQMLPVLDRAVVSTALAQLRGALPADQEIPFKFSVNLSAATLGAPGFDDWLLEMLERQAISPKQLSIEITESGAASSLESLQRTIGKLSRAGVRLAIDDFGTGINSLSHIKALDVATIKLDGSYVRDVTDNQRSQALVRAIVQMADSMGIVTIAEYVDSIALRSRLKELGVNYAQGFAVGRPEPLADLLASLPQPVIERTA